MLPTVVADRELLKCADDRFLRRLARCALVPLVTARSDPVLEATLLGIVGSVDLQHVDFVQPDASAKEAIAVEFVDGLFDLLI